MNKIVIFGLIIILVLILVISAFVILGNSQGSNTYNPPPSNTYNPPPSNTYNPPSSNTYNPPPPPISNIPLNTLYIGDIAKELRSGSTSLTFPGGFAILSTSSGQKTLGKGNYIKLDQTGNLIIYDESGVIYLQSNTSNQGVVKAVLTSTDLVLFDSSEKSIWDTNKLNVRIKSNHNLFLYIDQNKEVGPRIWQWNNVNDMKTSGRWNIVQNTDNEFPGAVSLKCADTGLFLSCRSENTVHSSPGNYAWERWIIKREADNKFSIYNPSWKTYLRAQPDQFVNCSKMQQPGTWELFSFNDW